MIKHILVTIIAAVVCCIGTGAENYSMEFCGKRTRLFAGGREVSFAACLKEQTALRKEFKLRDLVKQAYQGAYGAGHAVINRQKAWEYFSREFAGVPAEDIALFEVISPDYCRINLGAWKNAALPEEWLFNMFLASTEIFPDSAALFKSYLKDITRLFPERAAEMAVFLKP
jgi:hypothetical protein